MMDGVRHWPYRLCPGLVLSLCPTLVLHELQRPIEVDATWAKGLAVTLTTATPTLAFSYATVLLAVDPAWGQRLLQSIVERHPRKALAAVHALLAAPGGQWLFDTAALTDPRSKRQVFSCFLWGGKTD
jgi:hypothetical protein